MELKKTHKWFYLLTIFWIVLVLVLGSWWLYLVFKLSSLLRGLNIPGASSEQGVLNMIKWEGATFFILMIGVGSSLFYMFFRDFKKTRAIQAFFASITHELKTPLASMRLQAEVIRGMIEDEDHSHEKLSELTSRLIAESEKFEYELDKSLQLSRMEQGAPLTLDPIQLERFLKKHLKHWTAHFSITIKNEAGSDISVMAEERALAMCLRNLFENSLRHRPESKNIDLLIKSSEGFVDLIYNDHGKPFMGNANELGTLFYKHNSSKGSGIGLYLIKQLVKAMKGQFIIELEHSSNLLFKITLMKGAETLE